MVQEIRSVGIIGGGTMGSGIAAACAVAGCDVRVLEADETAASLALSRILATAGSEDERDLLAERIQIGTVDDDLDRISDSDWICEAIVEDLAAKRDLFAKLEAIRRDGSVVSTNTSGIPLRSIIEGLPERLRRDIVVTHFFNPVQVMRLVEIVAGPETERGVRDRVAGFCRGRLGKGVVFAKDTVNFIANRIGCFWMLSGLHKAKSYLAEGLNVEAIDALMGEPVGLPSTGLFGLIDLIGLDVMHLVGVNLAANLPLGDPGHAFAILPPEEQAMLARGQLGRKAGGGFYRLTKLPDGGKRKEVFDPGTGNWRDVKPVRPPAVPTNVGSVFFGSSAESRFVWDLLGGALFYAADLVPDITDDVVGVDRAMRWGFGWKSGPFELLDAVGPRRLIDRLEEEGRRLPRMLSVLQRAGAERFYEQDQFLGVDGRFRPIYPE
jgi:3-hydroxyacyl-CoA dehydrogenase